MKKFILSLLLLATVIIPSSCNTQTTQPESIEQSTKISEKTKTEETTQTEESAETKETDKTNNPISSEKEPSKEAVSKVSEESKPKNETESSKTGSSKKETSEESKQEDVKKEETKKSDDSNKNQPKTSNESSETTQKETSKEESKQNSQVSRENLYRQTEQSKTETSGEKTVKPTTIQATSIRLPIHKIELYVGDTYTMSAEISPSNVTDKSFTWRVSNSNIFEIKNNVVTAKKAGEAFLNAVTANGKEDSCKICVKEKPKTENTEKPKEKSKTETSTVIEKENSQKTEEKSKLDKAYESLFGMYGLYEDKDAPDFETIEQSLREMGEKNGLIWEDSYWCKFYDPDDFGYGSIFDIGVFDMNDMHRHGIGEMYQGPTTYDYVDFYDDPAKSFRKDVEQWVDTITKQYYKECKIGDKQIYFKYIITNQYYHGYNGEKMGYTVVFLNYSTDNYPTNQ